MASCLGIHVNDKILKYAKLSFDNKKVSVLKYGIKFITTSKMETIKSIVTETNSEDVPVALSTYNDDYQKISIFKNLSKNDMKNVINLEFSDWCEKNGKEQSKYSYAYYLPENVSGDYFNGMLNIIAKEEIDLYRDNNQVSISSLIPTPFTIKEMVSKDEANYILVNLDDRLYMTTVIAGKVVEFNVEDIGMKTIIEKLIELLGSEQKAYEACKKINVFTEGESTNQKDIEEVTEPILQEILKKISELVNRRRSSVNKIIITGMGTVFTNLDILCREFVEIKTEILKPFFLGDIVGVRNIAEALEAVPAMSVAYQYLTGGVPNIEHYKKSGIGSFFKVFGNKEKPAKVSKNKDGNTSKKPFVVPKLLTNFPEKATPIIISMCISLFLILVTYITFGNVYANQMNKLKNEIDTKSANLSKQTKSITDDIAYIDNNKTQYKTINDEIQTTVDQIESSQLGKINTYNIASFMQKIIKVIPTGVQLKNITTDENKGVKITAQSASYPDLGYFVAQLKLQEALKNVKINKVTNSSTIEVEIGGDLP